MRHTQGGVLLLCCISWKQAWTRGNNSFDWQEMSFFPKALHRIDRNPCIIKNMVCLARVNISTTSVFEGNHVGNSMFFMQHICSEGGLHYVRHVVSSTQVHICNYICVKVLYLIENIWWMKKTTCIKGIAFLKAAMFWGILCIVNAHRLLTRRFRVIKIMYTTW